MSSPLFDCFVRFGALQFYGNLPQHYRFVEGWSLFSGIWSTLIILNIQTHKPKLERSNFIVMTPINVVYQGGLYITMYKALTSFGLFSIYTRNWSAPIFKKRITASLQARGLIPLLDRITINNSRSKYHRFPGHCRLFESLQ